MIKAIFISLFTGIIFSIVWAYYLIKSENNDRDSSDGSY
jgi:hypothetical protein